jgi:hypothetical protein
MQPLRWDSRPDGLRAPALICAFKGWNDAGESATSALAFVAGNLGAEAFATIDPEEFVDFQATRPATRTRSPRSKRPASTSASLNARAAIAPVRSRSSSAR